MWYSMFLIGDTQWYILVIESPTSNGGISAMRVITILHRDHSAERQELAAESALIELARYKHGHDIEDVLYDAPNQIILIAADGTSFSCTTSQNGEVLPSCFYQVVVANVAHEEYRHLDTSFVRGCIEDLEQRLSGSQLRSIELHQGFLAVISYYLIQDTSAHAATRRTALKRYIDEVVDAKRNGLVYSATLLVLAAQSVNTAHVLYKLLDVEVPAVAK